jgi:hypothetical protein
MKPPKAMGTRSLFNTRWHPYFRQDLVPAVGASPILCFFFDQLFAVGGLVGGDYFVG